MIKTIIFDAFGTLFKVTGGASARTIISHIEQTGITICEKDFLEEWKTFYKEKTKDSAEFLTEREIFIARIKMFYDRYKVPRDAASDADDLLKEAHQRKAYDDTLPALSELEKNYSIFIGSNTDNDVLNSVMKYNGVFVHKVYTSENLRCYKPSARFYEQILSENNLIASEVLFVGDSICDDVFGPQQLGIKTCRINRNNSPESETKPDITVKRLTEIKDKIINL